MNVIDWVADQPDSSANLMIEHYLEIHLGHKLALQPKDEPIFTSLVKERALDQKLEHYPDCDAFIF